MKTSPAKIATVLLVALQTFASAATDPWYDVRDYGSFSAAVSAIGTARASLRIPNVQAVTANVTVPPNIQLFFIEKGELSIASGITVIIQGAIEAPQSQIFNGLGTPIFATFPNTSAWDQVNVKWFGAVGDGANNDGPAITKALNAFPANTGGRIFLPPGVFNTTSTITIPPYRKVVGSGMRITYIRNTGGGDSILLNKGTNTSSLSDVTIVLMTSNSVGIHLDGDDPSVETTCYNHFSNIEIVGSGSDSPNQCGLKLASSYGAAFTVINFNVFNDFFIFDTAYPVVIGNTAEANVFKNFHIERPGTTTQLAAVNLSGHANQLSGFWIGGRGSNVTSSQEVIGIKAVEGSRNVLSAIADIGTGYLFDLNGGDHVHTGTGIGDTKYAKNMTTTSLGRVHNEAALFNANIIEAVGANRDLWIAGISGYSNGFTVQYNQSPQSMVYGFANGPVGIGITPTASGVPSLHIAGGISQTATPARNLRGSITFSNTASTGTVTFGTAEANATYYVTATASGATGSPAAGAKRVSVSGKSASGFSVALEAAPGSGNSVTVDWMLLR